MRKIHSGMPGKHPDLCMKYPVIKRPEFALKQPGAIAENKAGNVLKTALFCGSTSLEKYLVSAPQAPLEVP